MHVDPSNSSIKGLRSTFLHALVLDLQARFKEGEWVQAEVEDWVCATSASCERIFSMVTQCDFGQKTERMCEALWVRCNGEAVEDWCPIAVFDKLREKAFRPRKRKETSTTQDDEDTTLKMFAALKDLPVSVDFEPVDVAPEIQGLWFVPNRSRAVPVADDIENVYGVGDDTGAGGEGNDSERDESDDDLPNIRPQQVPEPSASSSGGGGGGGGTTSSNTTISGGVRVRARLISDFQYPVDVHVLRAMKEGRMHEWTNVE